MDLPSTHVSLLLALQDGDHREEAWVAFQARYRDVILLWCRRRGLTEDDAADVCQDVLFKLFQVLDTYDGSKGLFRSWLKAIVNNALTDWWRRQRRRPEHGGVSGTAYLDLLARLETPEAADELSGVIEERLEAGAKALAWVQSRVAEKTWQAAYQTKVLKRPAKEVAAELGLSVLTVYEYVKRVKEKLEEYFDGASDH